MITREVKITGLRELQGAFKRVNADLPKELRLAFRAIADKVVSVARGKVTADVGPGPAASSIRPRATQRGAGIAFGGPSAPHMPWLDFGGSVGRGHKPGMAWSGAVKRDWRGVPSGSGRYVYPAISEQREETAAAVDLAIKRVSESAGFDTTGGLL